MPDNTIEFYNVPGQDIIFRNFRGKSTPVTKEGNRSFCLVLRSSMFRDQLAARGCNIKKLTDGTEFVNVAVRIEPTNQRNAEYKTDNLWQALDVDHINKADLEFTFHEYNINGKKGTKIYLKNARFSIKDLFERTIIDIRWPDIIRVSNSANNANNTEETKMNTMTRAEVMGQLQLGITAFEMNESSKKDPVISKLMDAMKNAIEYIGEVPKNETKVKTVTVERNVKLFPEIKQVIFNDPATVVVWFDDVKTVVKCQDGDTFDKEKGLAMAICKRLYGNESNFNNLIKKWTEPKTKKVERQAQVEANKTAKGKSKAGKKKDLDEVRCRIVTRRIKNVKDTSNVIITDAYINHVRVKMAKRGIKSYNELAKMCGVSQTTFSRSFGNAKRKSRVMYRSTFNKINKTLGIRWG